MRKILDYIKFLESEPSMSLRCAYCGTEIASYSAEAICPFCGALVNTTDEELKGHSTVYDLLLKRYDAFKAGGFDSANAYSEEIINSEKKAESYYGAAVFYEAASDYFYNNTNYGIYGYMEENAANKVKAKEMLTKAKQYFYTALDMCNDNLSNNFNYEYLKFTIELRLKRIGDAKSSLDELSKSSGSQFAKDYAKLAFYVEAKQFKAAKEYLEKLPQYNDIWISYYAARVIAEMGDYTGSKRILEKILKVAYMPRAQALLHKVEEASDI